MRWTKTIEFPLLHASACPKCGRTFRSTAEAARCTHDPGAEPPYGCVRLPDVLRIFPRNTMISIGDFARKIGCDEPLDWGRAFLLHSMRMRSGSFSSDLLGKCWDCWQGPWINISKRIAARIVLEEWLSEYSATHDRSRDELALKCGLAKGYPNLLCIGQEKILASISEFPGVGLEVIDDLVEKISDTRKALLESAR